MEEIHSRLVLLELLLVAQQKDQSQLFDNILKKKKNDHVFVLPGVAAGAVADGAANGSNGA